MSFNHFAGGKQQNGLDAGNCTTLCKGRGDIRGSNFIGKFCNGQDIKATSGEENGMKFSPEIFDGGSDGFKTVFAIFQHSVPGFGCIAHLMAEV